MKIEELIKERDLVKEALQAIAKIDAEKAELAANEYVDMKFLKKPSEAKNSALSLVSLYTDEHGEKWVRVKAWDEDFLLSIHDMRDGDKEDFTWEEAMKLAESKGQELPSKKQWMIIDVLRDDIDKIIKENNGDELNRWYWSKSVAQFSSGSSWLYYGNGGSVGNNYKYHTHGGRSLVYLNS